MWWKCCLCGFNSHHHTCGVHMCSFLPILFARMSFVSVFGLFAWPEEMCENVTVGKSGQAGNYYIASVLGRCASFARRRIWKPQDKCFLAVSRQEKRRKVKGGKQGRKTLKVKKRRKKSILHKNVKLLPPSWYPNEAGRVNDCSLCWSNLFFGFLNLCTLHSEVLWSFTHTHTPQFFLLSCLPVLNCG